MHILPDNILVNLAVLAVSVFVLSKSAGFLVDGAVGIAVKLNVPKIFIGVVLVGFATTSPEFVVSLMASIRGMPEIALGNAIGSVITDDALALALGILVAPQVIRVHSGILKSVGIFLIAIDLFAFGLSITGQISRWEGMILVALLIGYMVMVVRGQRRQTKKQTAGEASTETAPSLAAVGGTLEEIEEELQEYSHPEPVYKKVLRFAGGLAGLIVASEFLVDSAVNIADYLGVPEVLIGLTIIAIGTSLPEIATCIVAARKGHGDLALGDILGADVLNVLWIIGMSAVANPINVAPQVMYFSFPAMIVVVATMLILARLGYRLQKWKGIVLLVIYVAYLTITVLLFRGAIPTPAV